MKLIIVLFVVAAFVASSLAWKNEICGLTSSYNPGRCLARLPVWTYDSSEKACVRFNYSGCGGNANRFGSLKDCIDTCVSEPLTNSNFLKFVKF